MENTETTATTANEPNDTRSDIEAAITSLSSSETTATPDRVADTTATSAKTEETTAAPDKTEETTATPAKKEKTTADPDKTQNVKVGDKAAEKTDKTEVDDPRWADRLAKAPPSWKPTTRELWEQIPHAARLEIHRREAETYKAISGAKESREFIHSFRNIIQPYEMLLEQEGGPIQGFQQYLKTASLLRMGTPNEKAMAVASAIQQFGVPIELLDQALASLLKPGEGGTAGAGAKQAGAAEFRDPRVDDLLRTVAMRTNEERARNAQIIDSELQAFAEDPENEYFMDVKDEMADILEIAAKRGKAISLQTAYRQATMLHPEISKLVEQKAAQREQKKLVDAAKKAKDAAVQVTGGPSLGSAAVGVHDTVRGSIEAAISSLSGR